MRSRRRSVRAGVVAGLVFAFVPMIGISPAHACSCVGGDDAQQYERADVVFRGTLPADTRTGGGHQPGDVVLTFAADRAYKGEVFAAQRVRTNGQGAACGLELSGAGP